MLLLTLAFAALPVADKAAPAAARRVSQASEWQLLRKRIKHVFVLYQENRSFDSYFGTFPGAEGLFSHPASKTPGFYQPILGTDGKPFTVHPFRIGPREFAADTSDVDHAHDAIVDKIHVVNGRPLMDRYAMVEESEHFKGATPPQNAVQYGELSMAYMDGDTIPFLWRWANRCVLCDHIFQTITGPSTPGNLAIIAAQTGVSQWIQHPDQAVKGARGAGVPVNNDAPPFWGSAKDPNRKGREPYNPGTNGGHPQLNLTFPSLPLTLAGGTMGAKAKTDRDPHGDLDDILDDVKFLTHGGKRSVPWGWFQEGFDREPSDAKSSDPTDAEGSHASYVTHHNGPQYFGYVSNNPKMSANLHGLNDFFDAISKRRLPAEGVFYVKGGYENSLGLRPASPEAADQKAFVGDDDHPGYSDAQISETLLARAVNAIARSPYWKDSVIIITWDDSEGDYDHVPPPMSTTGPDGKQLSDGPRVPMIVLSPYAKTHTVFHGVGDQSSVVKFVDRLFNLTPLADLPVERRLRSKGRQMGIRDAGPRDDQTDFVTDLLGVFDAARLARRKKALSASYVAIEDSLLRDIPQRTGYGLRQLGIIPTDRKKGIQNQIPPGFSPRPHR
ncbi:MAG: phospholipase C [Fimbriimonadaceae bacterium]